MSNRVSAKFFAVGVIALFCLCFVGMAGNIDNNEISVWTLITKYNYEIRRQYSCFRIYSAGINDWFVLLLPIAVSFPTISQICDERMSKFDFFIVNRIGLKQYTKKTYLVTVFNAMTMLIITFILYGSVILLSFPLEADYGHIEIIGVTGDELYTEAKMAVFVTGSYVLWAGAMAGVSYMFSSFQNNIYINVTLPFLLNYIFQIYIRQNLFFYAVLTILVTFFISYIVYCYRGRLYGTM